MKFRIEYNEGKNLLLKETRKISFGDVIEAYRKGKKLADLQNKRKGRKNQRLLVVDIDGYAFVSPYVIDKNKKKIFLKTVYPSRKLTKKYIKNAKEKI